MIARALADLRGSDTSRGAAPADAASGRAAQAAGGEPGCVWRGQRRHPHEHAERRMIEVVQLAAARLRVAVSR